MDPEVVNHRLNEVLALNQVRVINTRWEYKAVYTGMSKRTGRRVGMNVNTTTLKWPKAVLIEDANGHREWVDLKSSAGYAYAKGEISYDGYQSRSSMETFLGALVVLAGLILLIGFCSSL